MPGDVVHARGIGMDPPRTFSGLLVSRVPNDELYDDDDYDMCGVLLFGRTKLCTYQGRFLTHDVVAA